MASIYDTEPRSQGEQGEAGQESRSRINVGRTERNASMASGAALALSGLTRLRNGRILPGLAMLTLGGMFFYRGKTGHCNMYEKLDFSTAGTGDAGIEIEKSMTVNKPARDVYNFWRHLENMPRFMRHLESVQVTGDRTSHWRAKAPAGVTIDWDAELLEDSPDRIRWRSLENADIPNEGVVEFHEAPAAKGTEVKCGSDTALRAELRQDDRQGDECHYRPAGGGGPEAVQADTGNRRDCHSRICSATPGTLPQLHARGRSGGTAITRY